MTTFGDLDGFRRGGRAAIGAGPTALLIVEDPVELAATLDHLAARRFASVVAFAPADITLPDHPVLTARVTTDTRHRGAAADAVNAAIATAAPGTWLHWCYNAEFLFHPFCETRSVGDMLAFHAEERRDAMLTYVIDLYADTPTAVDRDAALMDAATYYALARPDPDNHGHPKARQLDFHGGLRWRFAEHVAPEASRIDRIALFRARPGLRMRADATLTDEEMNTYACPWHNNLTAAVASFRAAKALRANPISGEAIDRFAWPGSVPFRWDSRQLMELGLMEPGQWF